MGGNAFETGARRMIPAVLVYVRRSDGGVLMIHRNSRGAAQDYHSGKWNGLGGKCDPDESALETARRELREESGLKLPESAFRALGVLHFPNFKPHKHEDWLVTVFVADLASEREAQDPVLAGDEGDLHWVPEGELVSLNLWAGDRYFIPHVVAREPFIGAIWYEGERVARHWIERLTPPGSSARS